MTREPMISDFYTVSNRAPLPPVDAPSIPKAKEDIISRPFEAYGSCAALFSDEICAKMKATIPTWARPMRRTPKCGADYDPSTPPRQSEIIASNRRADLVESCTEWVRGPDLVLRNPDTTQSTVVNDIKLMVRAGRLVARGGNGANRHYIRADYAEKVPFVLPAFLGKTQAIISLRAKALRAAVTWMTLAEAFGDDKSTPNQRRDALRALEGQGLVDVRRDATRVTFRRTKKGVKVLNDVCPCNEGGG